jgi:hypothetical protein
MLPQAQSNSAKWQWTEASEAWTKINLPSFKLIISGILSQWRKTDWYSTPLLGCCRHFPRISFKKNPHLESLTDIIFQGTWNWARVGSQDEQWPPSTVQEDKSLVLRPGALHPAGHCPREFIQSRPFELGQHGNENGVACWVLVCAKWLPLLLPGESHSDLGRHVPLWPPPCHEKWRACHPADPASPSSCVDGFALLPLHPLGCSGHRLAPHGAPALSQAHHGEERSVLTSHCTSWAWSPRVEELIKKEEVLIHAALCAKWERADTGGRKGRVPSQRCAHGASKLPSGHQGCGMADGKCYLQGSGCLFGVTRTAGN